VAKSWTEFRVKVKSRCSAWARELWLGRKKFAERCRRLKRENAELQDRVRELEAEARRERNANRQLREEARRVESGARSQVESLRLPDDPPLVGHRYGLKMMSLCVNVARRVGLRATEAVLQIVFEWLGIVAVVPDWTAIRTWMQRLGVAAIEEPLERADDWVWLADHSNQIGPEKVLVVLGVQASQLPPPGTPLRHEDVHVLAVRPGTTWKIEDVAAVYKSLAERHGAPRAVLSDGAVELRDGAEVLKKSRPDAIVLGDFKHRAANVLKSIVGGDPRFAEFQTHVGRTRSAIQQSELAHLVPPAMRPKARFMNLAATLHWATTMLWLLDTPDAKGRASITAERLEDKLGWLRPFAADIARWMACQRVVSTGVTFINEQGLSRGAADRFGELVADSSSSHAASCDVAARLTTFLREAELLLAEGERLPLSTEILESSFALYKQLERQHSKSGFTSLIATFASLLRPATPAAIRSALERVKVKDVREWLQKNLAKTLTAKRLTTYREFNATQARATKTLATT
jgi:hypothetical protein